MKNLIPVLLTILTTSVFAQWSPKEILALKKSSPYCVDKVNVVNGRPNWIISNSCFRFQAKPNKRTVASAEIQPVRNTDLVQKVDSVQPKANSVHQFNVGVSANYYRTDVDASSLGARVGYKTDFTNSFEAQAIFEIEKYLSIDSSEFEAKINKPVYNGSLIGFKKLEKLKIGAELGVKHYIQVIDTASRVRFDMTPFLSVGPIGKYSVTEKSDLGASASYLKASDSMDSKGYEFKAFGSYSFGKNQKYSVIPTASITKLKNSFKDISNNKLSVLFQVGF